MQIGDRLKRLRMINALTQEELARRTDLTKGYISQLENDTACPSIATLKGILDVLGISMHEFFGDPVEVDVVFNAAARVQATPPWQPVMVELLIPGAQSKALDPALVTLKPGAEMAAEDAHQGEEFGFVMRGLIEIQLDGKTFRAKKDDCFLFKSDRCHAVRNIGKGAAQILWVVTPPTFDYTG